MSYARFGYNSDVYVFMHVGNWLECCMCILSHEENSESFSANDTQTMIDHLKKHEVNGHCVPPKIYSYLLEDNEKNFGHSIL